MNTPRRLILTLNAGSSGLKFAIFQAGERPLRVLSGDFDRIGRSAARFKVSGVDSKDDMTRTVAAPDHTAAFTLLMDWMSERIKGESVAAIGHRVVHGSPKYCEPQRVSDEMIAELRRFSPLDPEHLPEEISLIEACRQRLPNIPQVACFDTAFHHDMPRVARLLPIPRRYGFHGLSYAFLMEQLAEGAAAQGKVVLAHLGNGASLAAVRDGRSVDTSMGFTPAAGVPMGTRSGDLDPGLVGYLARTEGFNPGRFDEMVNFQSGLLGVSGTSSDMRDLLKHEARDAKAADAVALFCYQVKKWIGAFAAALGGLDALVFSGGIGENAPGVRARICEGLEFLGVELDQARNARNEDAISTGRASVRVIRTDEELMIARAVSGALGIGIAGDRPGQKTATSSGKGK